MQTMRALLILQLLLCSTLQASYYSSFTQWILSLPITSWFYPKTSHEPIPPHIQQTVNFDYLVQRSDTFAKTVPFPLETNRLKNIVARKKDIQQAKRTIEEQARTTYPLIHKDVVKLIDNFLAYKQKFGSQIEQQLYTNMTQEQFITRLLMQRPLMFMNPQDDYLLRDGTRGSGGFETVGTDQEKAPLLLKDYLSYDEMQIAALVAVSTPTYFINRGDRNNAGRIDTPSTYQETGVYVGLVGARFEKPHVMESQYILITQNNSTKTTLSTLWSGFYQTPFATFEQATQDTTGRFIKINNKTYFDTLLYKKRMALVIEPFLHDANYRAQTANKKAYCHVVGLGLGVWQIHPIQTQLLREVYRDILEQHDFPHIAHLDFSWIQKGSELSALTRNKHIRIHFSKRNPADKLDDDNLLLVAQYAWDANAYPGNEYWIGALTASGDPAATACSIIAQLQNPIINPYVAGAFTKTYP